MAYKRALVLLPCCSEKNVDAGSSISEPPIPEVEILRSGLQEKLKDTPALAVKPENREGLLNEFAPCTAASSLYQGRLFQPLNALWTQNTVDILIVSAAYGLVKPKEMIKNYELQM